MSNQQESKHTPGHEFIQVGDFVKCLFGNSGNKFWTSILGNHGTILQVNGLKINKSPEPNEINFMGSEEWFHVNDFESVSSTQVLEENRNLKERIEALVDNHGITKAKINQIAVEKTVEELRKDFNEAIVIAQANRNEIQRKDSKLSALREELLEVKNSAGKAQQELGDIINACNDDLEGLRSDLKVERDTNRELVEALKDLLAVVKGLAVDHKAPETIKRVESALSKSEGATNSNK